MLTQDKLARNSTSGNTSFAASIASCAAAAMSTVTPNPLAPSASAASVSVSATTPPESRNESKDSGVVYNPQSPRFQPTHSPLRPTSETAIMNDSLQASFPRSASNLARVLPVCNRDAACIGSPFAWPDPSSPCTFAVWQNANAKPSLLTLGPRLAFSLPLCAGHPRSECISQSRRARGCT